MKESIAFLSSSAWAEISLAEAAICSRDADVSSTEAAWGWELSERVSLALLMSLQAAVMQSVLYRLPF